MPGIGNAMIGTAPAAGAALVQRYPTEEHQCRAMPMPKPTPSSCFPEHLTRPQCADAVSSPALQRSKRLPVCGIRRKESNHPPMSYAFPQGWMWNLSSSAWVVKKFILLLTVSPGLPRKEVGLLW